MSQSISLSFGPPLETWNKGVDQIFYSNISECTARTVEPVGQYFFSYARQKLDNSFFNLDEHMNVETQVGEDELLSEESEEEAVELLNRDPKEWKEQDHYAVLGLSKYRWDATDEQIKRAYRKKVLKHHPDKKASSGNTNDDAFFKCIQKAHEVLSDQTKRRQFDSIDPAIDDSIPPTIKTKGSFFQVYGPVFKREARYNFDSWRSFEYLDKEDLDNTENRDDKRYLEKKNKAERAKRKKEDTVRLRKIIDQAVSSDPRIIKFRQEEKAAKEAKKKEKEAAALKAQEEAKKAVEEERLKKEKAEAEAKLKQLDEKKDKTAKKKAMRNERKNIKTNLKSHNYFYPENERPSADIIEIQLSELDILFENLSLEELKNVRTKMESSKDRNDAKQALIDEATRLIKNGILSSSSIKHFYSGSEEKPVEKIKKVEVTTNAPKDQSPWSEEETTLLIKAANRFPGGTIDRWEKISEYISIHSKSPPRKTEDLVKKSREVLKGIIIQPTSKK
ncbi:23591_t:CDS:10 [Entrophospora sp. SA101]|nr:3140_t:CDS:10 [Entrophospora sp. SA101]CAJ0749466.1 23591_t:CDS:10 [Entrophospora sp. SA101]CAJ0866900.1 9523_t:CDS:10 [Entrophospora sp. SA101]CAJ0894139.1 17369_t:CDS:10 [Entrophospora sp. SA101]